MATRYSFETTDIYETLRTKLNEATELPVKDIFWGSRPTNNEKQRKEMLVVQLVGSIRQHGAYQSAYLRIEIIVKDKNEGRTNLSRLNELANQVTALFPMQEGRFNANHLHLVMKGKDTIGYSVWHLQGTCLISKLDTY